MLPHDGQWTSPAPAGVCALAGSAGAADELLLNESTVAPADLDGVDLTSCEACLDGVDLTSCEACLDGDDLKSA